MNIDFIDFCTHFSLNQSFDLFAKKMNFKISFDQLAQIFGYGEYKFTCETFRINLKRMNPCIQFHYILLAAIE